MKYYAKKIGDVFCVAIDDGKFAHRDEGHVWGCDSEQQAIDLAKVFNDEAGEQAATIARLTADRDRWATEYMNLESTSGRIQEERDRLTAENERLNRERDELHNAIVRVNQKLNGILRHLGRTE